jgi:hypothetical protein
VTVRASCLAVIYFVERLVGDLDNEHHNQSDIQAALDLYRVEARYEPLTAVPTKTASATTYLIFTAPYGWGYWETDSVLYNSMYTPLTPATSDWTNGRWTFAAEPLRPVTILGFSHDPYAAAADLLEVRAEQVAEAYDFKTGPDSYMRSQMQGQLLAMAARYRNMARNAVDVSTLVRSDVYGW